MDARHAHVGEIRRFGPVGPLYEVLAELDGAQPVSRARIRLIATGEEADYPLAQLVDDPVVV